MRRFTTEEFIRRAKEKHGDLYDYSLVNYTNNKTKVIVVCEKHGQFDVYPHHHIKKKPTVCLKCFHETIGPKCRMTQEEFIRRAKEKHGDLYDYSLVNYVTIRQPIEIICKIHGVFKQLPGNHLAGRGCVVCNNSKGELRVKNFLDRYKIVYNTQEWFSGTQIECRNPLTTRPLKFDFYLRDYNLCVEYDGQQHFNPYSFSNNKSDKTMKENLEYRQYKDSIKSNYCLDNNIELLRIPYHNIDNIEEILKERLCK
jgi:very-short-patch-repair endonuclease